MKKLLKIFGMLSLVFLILLVATFFAIKALFPPAKLREMVEPRIEKAIGREIEFSKIGIAFSWGFGVRLEDLKISNRAGFSEKEFLSVDRILLRILIRPLLQRQLQVSHVILEKPEILIERNKKGEFNFGDWQKRRESLGKAMKEEEEKKRSPDSGFALLLSSLRVKNGTLIYDDHLTGRTIKVRDYNQNLSLAFEGETLRSEGGISIGDLQIITAFFPLTGLAFDIEETISFDLSQNRLEIEKFNIKTGGLTFPFTGSIEELGVEPKIDLSLNQEGIELQKLLALIPPPFSENINKFQSNGTLDLNLQVKSEGKGGPNILGRVALHNIGLQGGALRQPLSEIEGTVEFTQNRRGIQLNAPKIEGKMGQSSFVLSVMGTRASKPRIEFDLKMDKILGEDWMAPPGMKISEESLMESLPPFLPDFFGNVSIDAIHFKMMKIEKFNGKVSLENGIFLLNNGICELYGGKGEGNFWMDLRDLTKRQFTADIKMDRVSMDNFISSLTPFKNVFHGEMGGTLLLSGEGSKPEEIRRTLSGKGFGHLKGGKIENLELQKKLAGWTQKDFFNRISFQDLSLTYSMEKGNIHFEDFAIFGSDADWLLSGMIGLDPPQANLNWDVTCRLSRALSQGLGLKGLTQFFKDSEGRIVLDFLISGTLENPKFAWNTTKTKDRIEKKISEEIGKRRKGVEKKVKQELEKKKEETKKELEKKTEEIKKELEKKAKEELKKIFPR